MHTSKLVWRLVALTSLAAAVGCGDDTSPGDGGDGGAGGAAGAGGDTSTTTTGDATGVTSGGGEGGQGGSGSVTTGDGGGGGDGGAGGQGGEGGAAPFCGDGTAQDDEACDGDDLAGVTCESLGAWFGTVACTDGCTIDASGCSGPEICDNGADDDLDGLADCSDAACLGDAACDGDGEVSCSNIGDDDEDQLIDCADPDCQAVAACAPGEGAPGDACTAHADCASAAGDDPLCLSAALSGGAFVGGYCAEFCDLDGQDCGAGATCLDIGEPVCLDLCEDAGDCRAGYDCIAAGDEEGAPSVCYPGSSGVEDCDNEADDDGDGFVDCEDLSCASDVACADVELACGNLEDDDEDGPIDCADASSCQAAGVCEPGDRPFGAPCVHPSECASPSGAPLCITDPLFANGACSSWCEDDADCGADGVCEEALGGGICLARCEALFDCFAGAVCDPDLEACIPFDEELCGNERDDDGDDLADCDDLDCAEALACSAPEAACGDIVDDDEDGQIDCADPTGCMGTPACEPGDGDVGAPCEASTDCDANAGDPLCLPESTGFAGGHCSEWCDIVAQDCAPGAVCVGSPLTAYCLVSCTDDGDCGEGTECRALQEGGALVCLPVPS